MSVSEEIRWEGKRILYVSVVDLSAPNGPGVNEAEFVDAMRDRLGPNFLTVVPGQPDKGEGERTATKSRWSVPGFVRKSTLLSEAVVLIRAIRTLSRERPDLIVVRLSAFPLGSLAMAILTTIPLAVKTVGDMDFVGKQKGWKGVVGRLVAPLHMKTVGSVLRRAVVIDVCTTELKKLVLSQFSLMPERVVVLPNATNVHRFTPGPSAPIRRKLKIPLDAKVIGYSGGRPSARGGIQILKALAEFGDTIGEVYGVIVGEDDGYLLRLAQELKVADRCRFTGVVPYAKVVDFIRCFDVGVALEHPERVAKVGNSFQKVRQYLSCGIPVVSSPSDQLFLEQNRIGSVVDADNPDEIKAALALWLDLNRVEREAVRTRARCLAEQHLSMESALDRRLGLWGSTLVDEGIW